MANINCKKLIDVKFNNSFIQRIYTRGKLVYNKKYNIKISDFGKVGDILFYDKILDTKYFISTKYINSASKHENLVPIGVVVIPSSHNVYGTGEAGVMSLAFMDFNNPDNGSPSEVEMYFGKSYDNAEGVEICSEILTIGSAENQSDVGTLSTVEESYLPSDAFYDLNTAILCNSDIKTKYKQNYNCVSPSQYFEDDSKNIIYDTEKGSSTKNVLSRFNGEEETKVYLKESTSDYKTIEEIPNSISAGYYTAACCCWRYHTEGTNQGDWYLPACGELGYMIPRINIIKNSIDILNINYNTNYKLSNENFYSTTNAGYNSLSKYRVYSVGLFLGSVSTHTKGMYNQSACSVRAFIKYKTTKNLGDILFYDNISNLKICVSSNHINELEKYKSRFIPIGIVVIPSSHDVYGTGQCGVMSLKEMSCTTPDTGSLSYQSMYWGNNSKDLSLNNLNRVPYVGSNGTFTDNVQMTSSAYLPSDQFIGKTGVKSPVDPLAEQYYNDSDKYVPSPYFGDERNPQYFSDSLATNACADFDGVGNTKVILDNVTIDYKSLASIPNLSSDGNYPAACCCWRYHTEGTNQGDWYLPACGELGYVCVRQKMINDTITKLNVVYPSVGVALRQADYWPSSEYRSNYARYVNFGYGRVYYDFKYTGHYVRAFLRV